MISGICVLVRQFSSSQQYFSSMFYIMFSFLPVCLQIFVSFWFTFMSVQVSLIDQSFLFLLPVFLPPCTFSLFPFFFSSSPALPNSLPSFLHVCCFISLKQDLLNRFLLQSKRNTLFFFSALKGASSAIRHYSDFSRSPCLSTILSSSFSCCKNIMAGLRKHEEVQVFPAT